MLGKLQATGLDRNFAIGSTVGQAVRAARDARQTLARSAGPDDIVDLIVADRARIHLRWEGLRAAARGGPGAEAPRGLARGWDEVAQSIDAHLAAMTEICLLAMLGTGPGGGEQMKAVLTEHEDVREVLSEARLQPPGSPPWRRLVNDAMSRWTELTERQASGVLADFALRADQRLRHRLGRQWRAFLAAWHQDHHSSPAEGRLIRELWRDGDAPPGGGRARRAPSPRRPPRLDAAIRSGAVIAPPTIRLSGAGQWEGAGLERLTQFSLRATG